MGLRFSVFFTVKSVSSHWPFFVCMWCCPEPSHGAARPAHWLFLQGLPNLQVTQADFLVCYHLWLPVASLSRELWCSKPALMAPPQMEGQQLQQ